MQDTDDEATKARDILRTMAGANAAPVLIEVPVNDIVATVFNRPVAAIDFDEAFGPGLLGKATGNTECGFKPKPRTCSSPLAPPVTVNLSIEG